MSWQLFNYPWSVSNINAQDFLQFLFQIVPAAKHEEFAILPSKSLVYLCFICKCTAVSNHVSNEKRGCAKPKIHSLKDLKLAQKLTDSVIGTLKLFVNLFVKRVRNCPDFTISFCLTTTNGKLKS